MTTPSPPSDSDLRICGLEAMLVDAQEEISELKLEIQRLREALQPFAEAHHKTEHKGDWYTTAAKVKAKDFARAAELVPKDPT